MVTAVQIQARLGSTRLPGKVLYPLGEQRILEKVIDRANTAIEPDEIIVTVGDQPENDAIVEWCRRNNINFYVGSEEDLLSRHLGAAKSIDSDPIIRITGDCPFIPPSEIDRVIREYKQKSVDYTTNFSEEMPTGTAVDVIEKNTLLQLNKIGDTHPVQRLRDNPEKWDVVFSPNDSWIKFKDTHIAVDTPEDYWTLSDAIKTVGDDPRAVAEWVAER